jgi:hypothetical protein
MKKSSNILLVVSSLAVVGVLGYLLLRQLKATQKVKGASDSKDAEYAKYPEEQKQNDAIIVPKLTIKRDIFSTTPKLNYTPMGLPKVDYSKYKFSM